MNIYEDENFLVKQSEIEGYGLFAKRIFSAGEVVLNWNPTFVTDVESVSESDKRYLNTLEDGTRVLMNIPERFVNHSNNPNTKPVGKSDVAIRDIKAGEEITSSYDFES